MLIHNCLQGSGEWLQLRCGIPTASEFDSIITPNGKPSKSAERYMFALLAERIMGHPRIESVSTWMDRGSQMEAEAVSFYELQRDCETVKVGFVSNDERTIGASPDRFIGDAGLLEIKVPAEHTHVSYLLKNAVDQAYYPQVQGQLWITGRKWADILSYHPEMPPALIRVERDEEFIVILSKAVSEFSDALEKMALELIKRGWITKAVKIESPWDDLEVNELDLLLNSAPDGTEAGFTSFPPQPPPAETHPPRSGDDLHLTAQDGPESALESAETALDDDEWLGTPSETTATPLRALRAVFRWAPKRSRPLGPATDIGPFMEHMERAKKDFPEGVGKFIYYDVLNSFGFSNKAMASASGKAARDKVLRAMIGKFQDMKLAAAQAPPHDAWTAQMLVLSDKDPAAFKKKMDSLGYRNVKAVPLEFRQGILETMRLIIR